MINLNPKKGFTKELPRINIRGKLYSIIRFGGFLLSLSKKCDKTNSSKLSK